MLSRLSQVNQILLFDPIGQQRIPPVIAPAKARINRLLRLAVQIVNVAPIRGFAAFA
jgi:hypothetical protein